MNPTRTVDGAPTFESVADFRGEVLERWRVIVVAGISVGVVVGGVGSRVAMLVLRLTSPDHVRGVTSDDGFTIGRVTLSGTYNLLLLGAAVGIIGAAAYRVVAPWLIGRGGSATSRREPRPARSSVRCCCTATGSTSRC
jgi:hypothetical protein